MMDEKSKKFLIIFSIFAFVMVFISFLRYFVFKDYYIEVPIPCNPEIENCFVSECDIDDEECTENGNKRVNYYKLIKKKAFSFPMCDPAEADCPAFDCDSSNCEEVLCQEDILPDGEYCSQ